MPTALQYMVKFKSIYGNNYTKVLKKYFGFFPFEVIDFENKSYITKEEFINADHPINITRSKEKWSFGLIKREKEEKELKSNLTPPSPNLTYIAIWNIITSKAIATKTMYDRVILNLDKIFYVDGANFVLLDRKYQKQFQHVLLAYKQYNKLLEL